MQQQRKEVFTINYNQSWALQMLYYYYYVFFVYQEINTQTL